MLFKLDKNDWGGESRRIWGSDSGTFCNIYNDKKSLKKKSFVSEDAKLKAFKNLSNVEFEFNDFFNLFYSPHYAMLGNVYVEYLGRRPHCEILHWETMMDSARVHDLFKNYNLKNVVEKRLQKLFNVQLYLPLQISYTNFLAPLKRLILIIFETTLPLRTFPNLLVALFDWLLLDLSVLNIGWFNALNCQIHARIERELTTWH